MTGDGCTAPTNTEVVYLIIRQYIQILAALLILVLAFGAPALASVHTLNPGDLIQTAVDSAVDGDIIILNPGIYTQHDITISHNVTLRANTSSGHGASDTIIDASMAGRIFSISQGHTLDLERLTLRNGHSIQSGGSVYQGSATNLSIRYVVFTNSSAVQSGGAVTSMGGTIDEITNSSFTNCSTPNSGGAIYSAGSYPRIHTIAFSDFTNCSARYGGAIANSHATALIDSITATAFSRCLAEEFGGAIYNSGTITRIDRAGTSASFTDCSAFERGAGIHNIGTISLITASFASCLAPYGGAIYNEGTIRAVISSSLTSAPVNYGGAIYNNYHSTANLHFCRIYQDDTGNSRAVYDNGGTVNATDNWWGTNTGPAGHIHSSGGTIITISWLVMNISASPASVTTAQTSLIRVNLTRNSSGMDTARSGIFVPYGIPVDFHRTSGTGSLVPQAGNISVGTNATRFIPSGTGTSTITATIDGQALTVPVVVTAGTAPVVSGITPASGKQGAFVTITNLSGSGFKAGAKVFFNKSGSTSLAATNVTVASARKITCTVKIPASAVIGPWDVMVKTTDGKSGKKNGIFMVRTPLPPTVTGVTPATGKRGALVTITNLSGTGFVATPKPVVQFVKGTAIMTATNVTVPSAKKITCTVKIPAGAAAGLWNVKVTNGDLQAGTKANAFTVSG
jgi:hypothetical protein